MTTRDERIKYARYLVRRNPKISYRNLNVALRERFGKGLRATQASLIVQSKGFARIPKEIRAEHAKKIILSHPDWGKRQVNKVLRKELGLGLRDAEVQHIKETTLVGRPKRTSGMKSLAQLIKEGLISPTLGELRDIQVAYHRMVSAGFLPEEISDLKDTQDSQILGAIKTKAFNRMLHDRHEWFMRMLKLLKEKYGWSTTMAKSTIIQRIRDERKKLRLKDPTWTFLRAVYDVVESDPQKTKLPAYREAARKRAIGQVKDLYGKGYKPI